MDEIIFQGKIIIHGEARGTALVSREPLSFWGGYDWKTGEIIDRRHMLSGCIAKGKILAVPFTRGSSTTTAVLLEAIRAGPRLPPLSPPIRIFSSRLPPWLRMSFTNLLFRWLRLARVTMQSWKQAMPSISRERVRSSSKGRADSMKLQAHLYLDQYNIPYEAREFSPQTEKGAANVAHVLGTH